MSAAADIELGEIDRLCRRPRMPYVRRHVGDVVATAKAQRWDPAEVVRVLLDEEARGRDASTVEIRRRRAAFPAGKTFDTFDPTRFSIPATTQRALAGLEWVARHENLVVAGPAGTGKMVCRHWEAHPRSAACVWLRFASAGERARGLRPGRRKIGWALEP